MGLSSFKGQRVNTGTQGVIRSGLQTFLPAPFGFGSAYLMKWPAM